MIVPGSSFIMGQGGGSTSDLPAVIGFFFQGVTRLAIVDLSGDYIRYTPAPVDIDGPMFGAMDRIIVRRLLAGDYIFNLYNLKLELLDSVNVGAVLNSFMGTWKSLDGSQYGFYGKDATNSGLDVQIYDEDLNQIANFSESDVDQLVGNRMTFNPFAGHFGVPEWADLPATGTTSLTGSFSGAISSANLAPFFDGGDPGGVLYLVQQDTGGYSKSPSVYDGAGGASIGHIHMIDSNHFWSDQNEGNIAIGINIISGGPASLPFPVGFTPIGPITNAS